MKTKIISIVVMLLMACNVMAQDYMRVYFKDGSERKFYLKDITSITTKKLDADGIQHSDYEFQHITTHNNKYIYNLNEVDSITFCKFNEEEVINNLSNALPDLFDIYSECGNIHDAENFIQHINNLKGVEKAWSDGHQLFVSFTGWETMSFEFNHDEDAESNSKKHIVEQAKSAISRMEYAVSPKAGQLRAVIANQQHYDESRRHYIDDYYLPLKKKLEDCNIHTTYEDKPDLAFFSDRIFTYDIVFLVTHGGYSGSTHVIRTGEEYGRFTKKKKYEFWKDEDDVVKRAMAQEIFDALSLSRSSYPESTNEHFYSSWRSETENGESCFVNNAVFTELFIEEYANGEFQNPYSIIFNTACQSLMGDVDSFYDIPYSDSLAQLFFNRNLGFYFGYNQTNTIGKKAGPYFYDLLLNGLSLTSAYANLPSDYVHEFVEGNDVYLIPLQNPSLTNGSPMFLIQTYTEQKDQEVAMDNFYSMKGVEVVGYTTTNKSDAITYGFAYGTDRNLSEATMITVTDTISLIKAIEQGNLRFRGTLTDLQPGNTYYYCAYTCDGSDYNCGDTLSFLIPIDLRLSTQELTLAPGSTTTVEITSGNGDYTVSVDKPSIAKASVSGTTVTIEGVANGTAKVTIKDKAGQTADIKVTISSSGDCPVAEAIDLGLPSGTLWASWNVGASKPEEYGGYYAWGETEEKENYDWSTYTHCDGSSSTCHHIGDDIAGTEYDVAHMKWGGSWRMPSIDQIKELKDNCTQTWTTQNGVNGILVTGPNGATIFLPAAGSHWDDGLYNEGSVGYFWSSSFGPGSECFAYDLDFDSGSWSWGRSGYRYAGFSIRAVISGLTISEKDIKLIYGNSTTIEITSGSGSYEITNSDANIVQAVLEGTTITLTAKAKGNAVVTVKDSNFNQTIDINIIVFESDCPVAEAIDLGLPSGTLWASWNVGASKPEEYGGYYAWGETEEKDYYDWSTYTHCDGSLGTCHHIGDDIAGTQNDVAHVMWGGSWRMPTKAQQDELRENCTREWTQLNGVNGTLVTGPNGNTIFLPAAGYRWHDYLSSEGLYGYYWSSSRGPSYEYNACFLYFDSRSWYWYHNYRLSGLSVRPVCP